MPSTDGSSTGAHHWCNHLENASEVVLAMVSLLLQPLPVALVYSDTASESDFQYGVSYQ